MGDRETQKGLLPWIRPGTNSCAIQSDHWTTRSWNASTVPAAIVNTLRKHGQFPGVDAFRAGQYAEQVFLTAGLSMVDWLEPSTLVTDTTVSHFAYYRDEDDAMVQVVCLPTKVLAKPAQLLLFDWINDSLSRKISSRGGDKAYLTREVIELDSIKLHYNDSVANRDWFLPLTLNGREPRGLTMPGLPTTLVVTRWKLPSSHTALLDSISSNRKLNQEAHDLETQLSYSAAGVKLHGPLLEIIAVYLGFSGRCTQRLLAVGCKTLKGSSSAKKRKRATITAGRRPSFFLTSSFHQAVFIPNDSVALHSCRCEANGLLSRLGLDSWKAPGHECPYAVVFGELHKTGAVARPCSESIGSTG